MAYKTIGLLLKGLFTYYVITYPGVGVREKMMKDDGHIWGGGGRAKDDDFPQK